MPIFRKKLSRMSAGSGSVKSTIRMFVLNRRYLLGGFLALSLWVFSSLHVIGMYDGAGSLAVMAPIFQGSEDKSSVSLMFNVDWGEEYIPSILEVLKESGASVTFFPTGTWAKDHADLLKEVVANGHEVGNHGVSHEHVEHMSKQELQNLIKEGEQVISEAAGAPTAKLFAPPYGEWSDSTVEYAMEMGYRTILWTADTIDWQLPTPDVIWKRALAGAKPGALILMHPTEPTLQALPEILAGLKEKGLSAVVVSDVLD